MNISVSIDEVSLATAVNDVLGCDEISGELISTGEQVTIADLVAAQIVERVTGDQGWGDLSRKVREIRAEVIREAVRPQIEQAIAAPVTLTNAYGEPNGRTTTLRELIIDEARKALNAPADPSSYGRDRKTLVQKIVAEQVHEAFAAEIADAVKQARTDVAAEIGQHVASAVQAAMKAR